LLDKSIAHLMIMLTRPGYSAVAQGMIYLADIDADTPLARQRRARCDPSFTPADAGTQSGGPNFLVVW